MGAAVLAFPHLSSALLTQVPAGDPGGFVQTLCLRRPREASAKARTVDKALFLGGGPDLGALDPLRSRDPARGGFLPSTT